MLPKDWNHDTKYTRLDQGSSMRLYGPHWSLRCGFRPQNGSGSPANTDIFHWDKIWKNSNWSWGILSTALFKVLYSYAGLNNVNNVLNEVKHPVRTLKTVAPAALVTACCLYLLVNIAYFIVVPIDELKDSGELIAALFFEKTFGAGFGKTVLPLAIAISAAGNVMVVTYALVRLMASAACKYALTQLPQLL